MPAEKIRESVIAGSWYTADPKFLKEELTGYLDRAKPPAIDGELRGIIVPHAGYIYSGHVAAWAYKLLLKKRFERVLVLAPSHHASFPAVSVYNLGGFRTPLGVVPPDLELIDELYGHPDLVRYVPEADLMEHSLEIQLPFLQTVLRTFSLAPVIMGNQRLEFCERLAKVVAGVCRDRKVLLVASSDLSHYHPYEDAEKLDRVCLDRIEAMDARGLAADVSQRKTEACGAGPMITIMLAAELLGADRATVLASANSGDVSGDRSGVVGYAAAAIYRSTKNEETGKL